MKKILLTSSVILITLLIGCISGKQSTTSGLVVIEKTPDWIEYNKFALENHQPILDFIATTPKKYKKLHKVTPCEQFSPSDRNVIVVTRWHNCNIVDKYEFKFYMPDGRLYRYTNFIPKKKYEKWTVTSFLPVKRLFPAQIQGKWSVEVLVNGHHVVTKEFYIGDRNLQVPQANTNLTVGVIPYWDDMEKSRFKHGMHIAQYISWAILNDYKNVNIIPPKMLLEKIPIPNVDYNSFEEFIKNDLQLEDSIVDHLVRQYHLNYIICGKVQSNISSDFVYTKVHTYIIDTKKKDIVFSNLTNHHLYRSDFMTSNDKRYFKVKIDKYIYSKIADKLHTLFSIQK